MSSFSKEEVERERARRRDISSQERTKLECIHCHSLFDRMKGGSEEGPLCDYCLHRGD